jgi:hypothetical protein
VKLRVGWEGNERGEQEWRVVWDRARFDVTIDPSPKRAYMAAATAGGEELDEHEGSRQGDAYVCALEVSIARWKLLPTKVTFTAFPREEGVEATSGGGGQDDDVEPRTILIVAGRAHWIALVLSSLLLLLGALVVWIQVHLPAGHLGEILKTVLATGFGAALLQELRDMRNPKKLPFLGLLHSPIYTAGALLVAGSALVFVAPRILSAVQNHSPAPFTITGDGDSVTLKPDEITLTCKSESQLDEYLSAHVEGFASRFALEPESGSFDPWTPMVVRALALPRATIICAGAKWTAAADLFRAKLDTSIPLDTDCKRRSPRTLLEVDDTCLTGYVEGAPGAPVAACSPSPPVAPEGPTAQLVVPDPSQLGDGNWFRKFAGNLRVTFRVPKALGNAPPLQAADVFIKGAGDFESTTFRYRGHSTAPALAPTPSSASWTRLNIMAPGTDHALGTLECGFPSGTSNLDVWQLPAATGLASLTLRSPRGIASRWMPSALEEGPAWACVPSGEATTFDAEIHLRHTWRASEAWSLSVPTPALAVSFNVYDSTELELGQLSCTLSSAQKDSFYVRTGPSRVDGLAEDHALAQITLRSSYEDGTHVTSTWTWSHKSGDAPTWPWTCTPGREAAGSMQRKLALQAHGHPDADYDALDNGGRFASPGKPCFAVISAEGQEAKCNNKNGCKPGQEGCTRMDADWLTAWGAAWPGCSEIWRCPR